MRAKQDTYRLGSSKEALQSPHAVTAIPSVGPSWSHELNPEDGVLFLRPDVVKSEISKDLLRATVRSGSQGRSGQEAVDQNRQAGRVLLSPNRSILRRQKLIEDLDQLKQEVCVQDWDGEGAAELHPETVKVARSLAMLLPLDRETPDIWASAFGEINFDWTIARDKRFTVGVGAAPDNDIAFALLVGHARWSGTEPWNGVLPTVINCCLDRLGQ